MSIRFEVVVQNVSHKSAPRTYIIDAKDEHEAVETASKQFAGPKARRCNHSVTTRRVDESADTPKRLWMSFLVSGLPVVCEVITSDAADAMLADQCNATDGEVVAEEHPSSGHPSARTLPQQAVPSVESTRQALLTWLCDQRRKVRKQEVMEAFGLTSAQALHDLQALARAGLALWTWSRADGCSMFEAPLVECPHCHGVGTCVEFPTPGDADSQPEVCAVCGSLGRVEPERAVEYGRDNGVLVGRFVSAQGLAYVTADLDP